jgi:hypothetical protein
MAAHTGSAKPTWPTTPSSKNVETRRLVRSMSWSATTKSPGAIGADRADADEVGGAELLQGAHVGAERDLVRGDAVPAAMAGEEEQRRLPEATADDGVAGGAEGGLHADLFDLGEAFDLVETAAADDAERGSAGGAGGR